MATARQIIAMLSSHNQGDSEQFLSIALQVAAAEADRGRNQVAEQLRKLVDSARSKQDGSAARKPSSAAIPIARPRGELQNLLDATYPRNELTMLCYQNQHATGWTAWCTNSDNGTDCAPLANHPPPASYWLDLPVPGRP